MNDSNFGSNIEAFFEGLFDVIQKYIFTVLRFFFHPLKSLFSVISPDKHSDISSPTVYFLISYVLMSFMLQSVDFTDRFFSSDLADILNSVGVIDAVESTSMELILSGVFPAVLILLFFVTVTTLILRCFGDKKYCMFVRRGYSYLLGNMFLLIGILSYGYHVCVRPVARISWWLGLVVHVLTMFPLLGVVSAFGAFCFYDNSSLSLRFVRWISIMIPILLMSLFFYYTFGSFCLMDYMRLRP